MTQASTPELDSSQPPNDSPLAAASLNRKDIAPLALLVAGLIALFSKVIFTPAMLFYRDVFNYSYPHARFIQEACRQATLPYWNPYLNYGEPVLANPNFLFFYPSTLLLILLPIDLAYPLHYVAHFAVAAAGTYALARRWEQSRAAAFFAAFVFAFSGPVLSLGNFYNHAACVAWIPWALLFTDRAVASASLRPLLLLTLVFSLQFLAAEPFTLLATLGLSLALALCRSGALRHPLAEPSRRIFGRFLLMGCFMMALSAVQLFPSFDLLQNSRRGAQGLPYTETSTWPFHPLSLLEVVLPDFFGEPFTAPSLWTTVLNGRNLPYFASVFVGFVPLFLGLAGWAWSRAQRRGFAVAAALILLVLSFGRLTPVFALAYLLLPPLELVRFPVKMLVPALLFAALLAGWGLDALLQQAENAARRWPRVLRPLEWLLVFTAVAWVAASLFPQAVAAPASWTLRHTNDLFLRGPQDKLRPSQVQPAVHYLLTMLRYNLPSLAGLCLGGVIWTLALQRGKPAARRAVPIVAALGLLQLVVVNYAANPTVPKFFYTYPPPVLALAGDTDIPYRFCSTYRAAPSADGSSDTESFLNFDAIPAAADFSPLAQVSFRTRLLLERGSMLAGVETSLNSDIERSLPPFVYDFWVFALRQTPDPARTDCLFGRTNAKYLILPAHAANATAREVGPIFNGSPQPSFLYEDRCFLPRAFVAERAVTSTDALLTLSRLSQPEFDARHEVLLWAGPEALPGGAGSEAGSGHAGEVAIVERLPNTVKLEAVLTRPGYVVLLDRFDPNWHATLDGREVPVFRANQMFRAVFAEPGKHQIQFAYHQRGLKTGTAVSLAALAVFLLVWWRSPGPDAAKT